MATHFQCCCLENPRDGGAWWAAVYGVAQSRTCLKRLSSSSSRRGSQENLFLLRVGSNLVGVSHLWKTGAVLSKTAESTPKSLVCSLLL